MSAKVGVVGIGAMGMGVAKRLLERGFEVHVRDIRHEAEEEARRAGASVASSPAAVARACPIVITLVVDAQQTEGVIFGAGGLVEGMAPGGIVVMCSTVAPSYAASLGPRLAEHGLLALDAPVSGGPSRARDGTMSVMIAGLPDAYDRARDVVEAISGGRFRISAAVGDGSKMKIVNNLMAGINLAAACEAMVLGLKMGLDAQTIHDVVSGSSGDSWIFEDRMARILVGDYGARAAVTILAKDLALALEAGVEARAVLPIGTMARLAFVGTAALGYGEEDDASVVKYYAGVAGVPLPGTKPV